MGELGAAAGAEHRAIGRYAAELGVDRVVAVGESARELAVGAGAVCVPDRDAAVRLLAAELRDGDVVLVKASRSAGLERVALELLADPAMEGRA
jgi:UDP-N-acetylmuramoyl-tripeptide--D-alanyl-D-alanine ligase